MKKIKFLLSLVVFILTIGTAISQTSFEKVVSENEDQVINSVSENYTGGYVMAGRIKNINTGFYGGYIVEIDSTGELINQKIIQYSDTESHIFFNIHYFNNSYILLGTRHFSSKGINKLWYLHLDSNLEPISERFYNLPSGKWISYMNSIIDSDTNLVITGYTTRNDTTTPSPYNNDPFFFKLSITGDSLSSKFISNDYHLSLSYDIIEKNDKLSYLSFGFKYTGSISSGSQRYELTKQFDSIQILSVPYNINSYVSSVALDDSVIILCGSNGSEPAPTYSLNVLSTTFNNEPLNYNYFKMEGAERDFSAYYKSIDIFDNNIFIAGTSNFDYANPFWSYNDSWFHLIKINPDLSPVWEYWYGGDAYYFLYSILATSDGGCIMVGNRYDYETQYQERDIYIVKVDENGIITWQQEITIDNQPVTVYPNPGTDRLNIKTNKKEFYFEMFDINGRRVTGNKKINDNNPVINTSSLKPGIYFYRLSENKTVETGKWIKR